MEQHNTHNGSNSFNKPSAEVGCCWVRKGKNDINYLSIKLEINGKIHYLKGFLNARKTDSPDDENKPTYIIYKSKDNRTNEINNHPKAYQETNISARIE